MFTFDRGTDTWREEQLPTLLSPKYSTKTDFELLALMLNVATLLSLLMCDCEIFPFLVSIFILYGVIALV
jgi:hypothetical protein